MLGQLVFSVDGKHIGVHQRSIIKIWNQSEWHQIPPLDIALYLDTGLLIVLSETSHFSGVFLMR